MTTNFGKFCRKLRLDSDESMQDMADKLGVAQAYVSMIETGSRKIPVGYADKLIKAYSLTGVEEKEVVKLVNMETLTNRERNAIIEILHGLVGNNSEETSKVLKNVIARLLDVEPIDVTDEDIELLKELTGTYPCLT